MDASASTDASPLSHSFEIPAWKSLINHLAAVAIAIVFLVSGVYKVINPYLFATLAGDLDVPFSLTLPLALALAVAETTGGVLVLVPRFRRWGGILLSVLLAGFIAYFAINYTALAGKNCSCFPTIQFFGYTFKIERAVGPSFFWSDAAMLAVSLLAAWWAKPSQGLRTAAVIVGAVAVFTGVSFGIAYGQRIGATAPESIIVEGKPLNLRSGKYFVFFFDPECSHCNDAAKTMGTYTWKNDVQVIGVATRMPQFDAEFMSDNKFNGKTSRDLEKLRAAFPFEGKGPYGVVLDNGRQVGLVPQYGEDGEPGPTLKKLGVIE
jgi:uncharacterized membrane protein YphA (DoxX/SURF4 family)